MAAGHSATRDWLRALEAVKDIGSDESPTFGCVLNGLAVLHGDRPALIDERVTLSYRALAQLVNRYASWAQSEGLTPGTIIGLLMPNCAEYVAAWAGLSHAGCVVALINTNLSAEPLAHAVRAGGCRHLIVDASHEERVAAALEVPGEIHCWTHGEGGSHAWPRLDAALARQGSDPPGPGAWERPSGRDRALLIYTSGTTGMPKAANVSHGRVLQWSHWFAGLMDTTPADRLYDCLPMYHSTGGVSAIGAMLVRGASVVIRRRFSARRFWDDVAGSGCTIIQYIGELCRYLLQAPQRDGESDHKVRLCCGNGLRAEVWQPFQARFAIPRILEFYAATEGPVSLYNCEGRPGAIGRIPGFLAHRFPLAIVRSDPETGELVRDTQGLCRACAPGETGEALGRLDSESRSPARRFEGYADPGVSSRKLAADVLEPGDLWYRTGDLMRRDADGFIYFIDRLGDAFRWKGENVSASEVAAVIGTCDRVTDAVAFGVRIPGTEGRAGMAAITVEPGFQLASLRDLVHARLPTYARPVFIRICREIARTGTFKLSAQALAREGYRAASREEELWFDHRAEQVYVLCSAQLLTQIEAGAIQL